MEPDVSQLVAGPGLLYIAPLGTALPNLTGSTAVFPTGWRPVGYTDAGIDSTYTPKIKPISVDEEASPVLDILESEDFKIMAHLAEVNLKNYQAAISASVLTTPTQLSGGSKALTYLMVAAAGPSVDSLRAARDSGAESHCDRSGCHEDDTQRQDVIIAVQFDAAEIVGRES